MGEAPFSPAANPDRSPGDASIGARELWRAVRKNWWLAAILTAVGAGAATFFTLGQTSIYQATSTVEFDPTTPRPLGSEVEQPIDGSADYWDRKEYYNTQYWVISSISNLEAVVVQLGLHHDPGFVENSPVMDRQSGEILPAKKAAGVLSSRLTVSPVPDSRLAHISYDDANPERAARVVNAVVDHFVRQNEESLMESTTAAADWLREQLDTLKSELETSELALHGYKREKNILSVSLDDQSNMLREQLVQYNAALTKVEIERARVAARQTELHKIQPENPLEVPAAELLASPVLTNLRGQYVQAQRERDALVSGGKGANHPEVAGAAARAEATRLALLGEVRNIQASLDRDHRALAKEAAGLRSLLEETKQEALALNKLEIEYKRLRRFRDTNERLYALVTERSKESDLTTMLRVNNVRVVERAQTPEVAVSPNKPLNVAIGTLAGLLLGLLVALGREFFDRSIKSAEEAESLLSANFLGLLPSIDASGTENVVSGRRRRPDHVVEGALELSVHNQPTSSIAEAARTIRTNIVFSSPDHPYRVLLVTSAAPGEGKTTVACSIASAMAQAGQRVVIVDCDMRRPRMHSVFGANNQVGLTSALLDPAALSEAIVETEMGGVSLLPTGPLPPNPSELLHSEAFGRVMGILRTRFDRIIVDSPPIVPVTDATVLSKAVDGTIMVVRAFQTTRDLAVRARRSLSDVGSHVVGVVLNAVDFNRVGYGYERYQKYHSYYGASSNEAEAG